jgi:hypothetical protein
MKSILDKSEREHYSDCLVRGAGGSWRAVDSSGSMRKNFDQVIRPENIHQRPGRRGNTLSYPHGSASMPLPGSFTSTFIPRLKFAFRPTHTRHWRSPLTARYRQITILGLRGILTISSSISVPLSAIGSRAFLSRSASAASAAAFAALPILRHLATSQARRLRMAGHTSPKPSAQRT